MSAAWYRVVDGEDVLFERAHSLGLPVLLKGPTGCGKTRFVQHMAERLERPIITVACQEDLSAADLTGRYLLQGGETVWQDGPVTRAVREGAILYLDEVVEARPDVLTLLHPLSDDRRMLTVERIGEEIVAGDGFQLVISYNPGYQSAARSLKESTRQRFVAVNFDYPVPEIEREIVQHESGCDAATAALLVELAQATRLLKNQGLKEGASTRLIIYAARLAVSGLGMAQACNATLAQALSDDPEIIRAVQDLIEAKID